MGELLARSSGETAQVILSLLVWPGEYPSVRVLDDYLREHPLYKRRNGKPKPKPKRLHRNAAVMRELRSAITATGGTISDDGYWATIRVQGKVVGWLSGQLAARIDFKTRPKHVKLTDASEIAGAVARLLALA